MKQLMKKLLASLLIASMLCCNTLPNFAEANNNEETTAETIISELTENESSTSGESVGTASDLVVEEGEDETENNKDTIEEPENDDEEIASESEVEDIVEEESNNYELDFKNNESEDDDIDKNEIEDVANESDVEVIEDDGIASNSDIDIVENVDIVENKLEIIIATISDARDNLYDGEKIATASDVDDYKNLSTFEQIIYNDTDSAVQDGNVIKLKKNIELNNTIYFKDDIDLDLAGFDIVGPKDDYALYIENNFTLINSTDDVGTIKGMSNEFSTIYINNGSVELTGGKIIGADGNDIINEKKEIANAGGDAITVSNSDIVIDGTSIIGGNGEELDGVKGGNGGDAVVVVFAKSTNKITINSGELVGGKGANGVGEIKPKKGSALRVMNENYEDQYFGEGFPGNIGGGNGGVGLNIKTNDFKSENLTYERWTLGAGSAGYSKIEEVNGAKVAENLEELQNKFLLKSSDDTFGASTDDASYSLHNVDGKNYITSLKNQRSTELCTVFSTTAYAETTLLKKYPDYVRSTLGKDVDSTYSLSTWNNNNDSDTSNDIDELNLSEMQLGMSWRRQPTDIFGNAGASYGDTSSNWANYGFGKFDVAFGPTSWRALVEEDDTLKWSNTSGSSLTTSAISQSLLDNYNKKVVVTTNSSRLYDASDFYDGTNFDSTSFVAALKSAILNNNGAVLLMYTCGNNSSQDYNDYTLDGVNYGTAGILSTPDEYSGDLGGHGLYCIGWDDNVSFTVTHYRTPSGNTYNYTYTGAFIIKNSWNEFSLVPYENNFVVEHGSSNAFAGFVTMDFVPSYSSDENIYYYDTGFRTSYWATDEMPFVSPANGSVGSGINVHPSDPAKISYGVKIGYTAAANTFKIRNAKEKIQKISIYLNEAINLRLSLYKVSTLNTANTLYTELNNDSNRISDVIALSGKAGMNVVDVPNDIDVVAGDIIAIKIQGETDTSYLGDLMTDTTGNGYTTVDKGRSFLLNPNSYLTAIGIPTVTEGVASDYVEYERGTAEFDNNPGNSTYGRAWLNSYNNSDYKIYSTSIGNIRARLITNNYVKINANNYGSFNGESTIYYYPALRSAMTDIPEPSNVDNKKIFVGYNTAADGSGTDYTKNSIYSIEPASSLELYAIYEDKYTLSFNAGGGTGSMATQYFNGGETTTVPACSFTRTGYTFAGWKNSSGAAVAVGSILTMNANVVLTATWTEKTYAINYVLNDGAFNSGYTAPSTRKYSADVTLPTSANISRSGFTFNGWFDNANCTGTAYTSTSAANSEKVCTFYAYWISNNNGGSKGGSTGGGGGGGGGGGSGIPATGASPLSNTTTLEQAVASGAVKVAAFNSTTAAVNTISASTEAWTYDPVLSKWKLSGTLANGAQLSMVNTFCEVVSIVEVNNNGVVENQEVKNTYYFDEEGNMVTGWLGSADGKWYYFDDAKDTNEGKLTLGWKQIGGSWYYFNTNGTMMTNGVTPDGYAIDESGHMVDTNATTTAA